MRVLVCDDNRDAADSLALLLSFPGHEVRTTYHGHDCVKAALKWRPHVALVDIGMPDLDGYRVATKLRAILGSEIVLVAITAYANREAKARAAEAGFDLHMADFLQLAAVGNRARRLLRRPF